VIIQVSRMEPWKGHALHLRALSKIRDLPNWCCWQVGGPSERQDEVAYFESLLKMARDLGVADRVRFLGKRSDVPRLLQAADCFCQPNLGTEGFSISFMEALMAGLPVVTTAIGGAVELINESCGFVIPLGDEEALTQSLRRLVREPELRERLGAAGYRRVHDLCDPARQLGRFKEAFSRVAGDRQGTNIVQRAGT
jgi:glycosyltransferase involved in cell wall biosynthesis